MIAYIDCFSGISGDMTLGAFIDIGVSPDLLDTQLKEIPLSGFTITVSDVSRQGIHGKQVSVTCHDNHTHRSYHHIQSLIEKSPLKDSVKTLSLSMFHHLAIAESAIHQIPLDQVHFHELGGIDTIVDIVGTALCIDHLSIQTIVSSKIPLGNGFVKCHHGTLPLPAPATIALLKDVPVYGIDCQQEIVTPTGATIIKTLANSFGSIPDMIVERIGYGAGQKNTPDRPNLLRIIMGHPNQMGYAHTEKIMLIETTIDDMNPELYGHVMSRLFSGGAYDVIFIPVIMKKNRPGVCIQVICSPTNYQSLVNLILSETTTTGVRHYEVDRTLLNRESVIISTSIGSIKAKRIVGPDGQARFTPEFESCSTLAKKENIPLWQVYDLFFKTCPLTMDNNRALNDDTSV